MKKERLGIKKTIKKKIEDRHKQLTFINSKINVDINEKTIKKTVEKPKVKPVNISMLSASERTRLRSGGNIDTHDINNDYCVGEIPKEIFFFWEGEKMSWMRYMTLYSFRKYNPDWKIKLYFNKDVVIKSKPWGANHNTQDFFNYDGDDYFNKIADLNIEIIEWDLHDNKIIETDLITSPSQKSNFLKWSKLYEDGGIYSDMDIIWFKPIDDFYNTLVEDNYDMAICHNDKYFSIGLLASKKNNPFYRDVFLNGFKCFNAGSYQTAGVLNIYNFLRTSQKNSYDEIIRKYINIKPYNIPMDLVYYLDSTKIEFAVNNSLSISQFPKHSIGYHWYAGHPAIQAYNNILNEENYMNHSITFTNIVNQILNE